MAKGKGSKKSKSKNKAKKPHTNAPAKASPVEDEQVVQIYESSAVTSIENLESSNNLEGDNTVDDFTENVKNVDTIAQEEVKSETQHEYETGSEEVATRQPTPPAETKEFPVIEEETPVVTDNHNPIGAVESEIASSEVEVEEADHTTALNVNPPGHTLLPQEDPLNELEQPESTPLENEISSLDSPTFDEKNVDLSATTASISHDESVHETASQPDYQDDSFIASTVPQAEDEPHTEELQHSEMPWDTETSSQPMPWENTISKPQETQLESIEYDAVNQKHAPENPIHQTQPWDNTAKDDVFTPETYLTEANEADQFDVSTKKENSTGETPHAQITEEPLDGLLFGQHNNNEMMPWDATSKDDILGTASYSGNLVADAIVSDQLSTDDTPIETVEKPVITQMDESLLVEQRQVEGVDDSVSGVTNEEDSNDVVVSEDLSWVAKEDQDFLSLLSKTSNQPAGKPETLDEKLAFLEEEEEEDDEENKSGDGATIEDAEVDEDKFGFLAEDDNLLLDDIMDDDLLDDELPDDAADDTDVRQESYISPDDSSNTVVFSKKSKYAPQYQPEVNTMVSTGALPSQPQTDSSILKKPTGPTFISSPSSNFIPTATAGFKPPIRSANEITQAKKKSDAYDFPQDLFEKKKHKPVKEVKENIYTRIENSIDSTPATPSAPYQQTTRPNPYAQPPMSGSATRQKNSPSLSIPSGSTISQSNFTSPLAQPNAKFNRSNSNTSNKSGSFFAELPVKLDSNPTIHKKNPYEQIESQSSLMASSPMSAQSSVSKVNSYAPVPNAYANASFSNMSPAANPPNMGITAKKGSNPYAPMEAGGHIRNQSKTVDPDTIKANLIPVPGNKNISLTNGSNVSSFSTHNGQQLSGYPQVQANQLLGDQPSYAQSADNSMNGAGKYAPHFQPPMQQYQQFGQQTAQQNAYTAAGGLTPKHQKRMSVSKAKAHRQSISSINDVYGSNIVTSAATSTGKRKTMALPPNPGKGRHHNSVSHTFKSAPAVINPENLVRRQWPLFSFSAENRIASMIPTFDGYGHTICNIKVDDISMILKEDQHIKSFPGPLMKNKTKNKELTKWLEDKISSLGVSNAATIDIEKVAWECLKHMVETIQNPGDFSSAEYIKGICTIMNPTLNTSTGMNSTFDPVSLAAITHSVLPQKPFNANKLDPSDLVNVHAMLEVGDKKSALEFVVREGDWALALLISNLMGPAAFNQITKLYSSQNLPSDKIGQDLSFFLQSNQELTAGSFSGKERWIVENFRVVIPFIMMDTKEFGKVLTAVGDSLMASGDIAYAKLSYLLSGLPIVPRKLSDNPSSIYGIIMEEIYEYILLSSGNVPPNFANGFPHMIPVKISHAGYLADVGLSVDAKRYSDFTQSSISSKKLFCEPATFLAQKSLCERLSQVESGWLSSKLSRPQLDKVWTTLDKSFNKFVAGQDIPQAEKKTEGVFSKFTPPVSLSRASSTLDLSDVQDHMNSGGLNLGGSSRAPHVVPSYVNNMPSSKTVYSPPAQVVVPQEVTTLYPSEQHDATPFFQPPRGRYAPSVSNSSVESLPKMTQAIAVTNIDSPGLTLPLPVSYRQPNAYSLKSTFSGASHTANVFNASNAQRQSSSSKEQPPNVLQTTSSKHQTAVANLGLTEKLIDAQRYPALPSDHMHPSHSLSSSVAPPESNSSSMRADSSSPDTLSPPVVNSSLKKDAAARGTMVNRYAPVNIPDVGFTEAAKSTRVTSFQPSEAEIAENMIPEEQSTDILEQAAEEVLGSNDDDVDSEEAAVEIADEEETNITETVVPTDVCSQVESLSNDHVSAEEIPVLTNTNGADSVESFAASSENVDPTERELVNENVSDQIDTVPASSLVSGATDTPTVHDSTVDSVLEVDEVSNAVEAKASIKSSDVSTGGTPQNPPPVAVPSFKPNPARAVSRSVNRYGPGNAKSAKPKPKLKNPYAMYTPKAQTDDHKKSAYEPAAPSAESEPIMDPNSMIPSDAAPIDMFSFGGYSVPEPTPISKDEEETNAEEVASDEITKSAIEQSEIEERKEDTTLGEESFEDKSDSTFVPTFIPHTQARMKNEDPVEPLNPRNLQNMFTPPSAFAEMNNTRRMSSPIHQFTEERRYRAIDTGEYYDDVVDDSDEDDKSANSAAQKRKEEEAKAAAKRKEEEEREAEAKKKKAEEEKQSNKKNAESSRWFGWIGKGKNDDKPKPIKAKLGEENSFYYDEKLKRWINKKAPIEEQLEASKPPPPPAMKKPAVSASLSPSPAPALAPATSNTSAPPTFSAPPSGASTPSIIGPKPVKKDGIDELLNLGSGATSAGTSRRTARRGPRRGYVDVMGNQ
jgi:hypothetical protein